MLWYVLKVQSNREKSIREQLLRRIKMEGLESEFGDVVIPTEKVVETKGGKRKVREQKLFPGYMMIRMRLTDETWYLVLGTNGVGDFTGAGGKPMPMPESEVKRLLGQGKEIEEELVEGEPVVAPKATKEATPVFRFSVSVGEAVKVKEGPFENFEGQVHSLDDHTGKVKVMIEIFGRSTEVELEHWQVEKV
ncbi:MAG: transcription termination/antitermination factor NusG [Planctomycetota bacterium]|nr:MAG: transcription termination/antitermination factor NusG [Planctomycetota bacterium]